MDEKLKRLGSTINYRVLFLRMIVFGGFWLFNLLLLSVLYINWLIQQKMGPLALIAFIIYSYSTNIGVIVLYEFIVYVWYVIKHTIILLRF